MDGCDDVWILGVCMETICVWISMDVLRFCMDISLFHV